MSVSKDSFDAALVSGVRDQLREAYLALRLHEQDVFQSVLDETGEFRPGLFHTRDCPLCASSTLNASDLYQAHGMHIVQCHKCELVYSREVINRDSDESRYRSSKVMAAHMALHRNPAYAELESNKARYIIGRLAQARAAPNTSLLDIGCSTGALLQAAVETGWQALGIELNLDGVQVVRNRGLNVVDGCFPQDLPVETGPFSVITMLDVLEHTEDPVGFLASVNKYLSDGGLLGVQVPNFNSLLIRIEGAKNNNICHGHWSYFTPMSLAKVAAEAGMKLLSIETIISEIDRIRVYPANQVAEAAAFLTGRKVELTEIDHHWIHDHLLGYKLLGIFSRA